MQKAVAAAMKVSTSLKYLKTEQQLEFYF
ncbi:hypothetical protein O9929_27645 [Vibrio lentus]|nr:hypothetical protein [Vibrio lentus]